MDSIRNTIVKEFHRLYYNTRSRTWMNTTWFGVPIIKCPFDLWVYQEMLFELRPDVVVECGTSKGGSAYFLSSMCELLGHGHVITIDLYPKSSRPQHERLTYLSGSSTDPQIVREVTRRIRDADGESASVLVLLDSDHSREHVLDELRLYSPLVTPGSYVIVEDTNLNGHPVWPDFGPGPMEAVDIFLSENDDFVIDTSREKFYMTWNPRGYLKRVMAVSSTAFLDRAPSPRSQSARLPVKPLPLRARRGATTSQGHPQAIFGRALNHGTCSSPRRP
jgi:cephalosporin hydroxylase